MIILVFLTLLYTTVMVAIIWHRQNVLIKTLKKTLRVLLKILHTISPEKEIENE